MTALQGGQPVGMSRPGNYIESGGFYYFVVSLCPILREELPLNKVPAIRVGTEKLVLLDAHKIARPLPKEEVVRLRWPRGVIITNE